VFRELGKSIGDRKGGLWGEGCGGPHGRKTKQPKKHQKKKQTTKKKRQKHSKNSPQFRKSGSQDTTPLSLPERMLVDPYKTSVFFCALGALKTAGGGSLRREKKKKNTM